MSQLNPSLLSLNRASRTSQAQWSVMVDFFIDHPEMVTRLFIGLDARQKYQQLWAQLATSLNSMGYGSKTPDKWIDAFTKWKSKVKTKAQAIKLGIQKTGGGGPLPPLTPLEEKLIGVIGWRSVNGDGTPELGLGENVLCCTPSSSLSVATSVEVASISQTTTDHYTTLPIPSLVSITPTTTVQVASTSQTTADHYTTLPMQPLLSITPKRPKPQVSQFKSPIVSVNSESFPLADPLEDHTYVNLAETTIENEDDSLGNNRKRRNGNANIQISKRKNNIGKRNRSGDQISLIRKHEETMSVLREISSNIGRLAELQIVSVNATVRNNVYLKIYCISHMHHYLI